MRIVFDTDCIIFHFALRIGTREIMSRASAFQPPTPSFADTSIILDSLCRLVAGVHPALIKSVSNGNKSLRILQLVAVPRTGKPRTAAGTDLSRETFSLSTSMLF